MNRQELAVRLLEHLQGKHNQKNHGRRSGGKGGGGLVTVEKKAVNPKGDFKIPSPAQVAAKKAETPNPAPAKAAKATPEQKKQITALKRKVDKLTIDEADYILEKMGYKRGDKRLYDPKQKTMIYELTGPDGKTKKATTQDVKSLILGNLANQ